MKLILIILLMFFLVGCEEVPEEAEKEPEEVAEEEAEEEMTDEEVCEEALEEEPEKDLYEDPLLRFFGKNLEYLLEEFGEPKKVDQIPRGTKVVYYDDVIFYVDDNTVNTILLREGQALGIELGMSFKEIEEVLGEPRSEDFDEQRGGHLLCYFLGEEREGLGEVEIYIEAEDKASADVITIIWKKYWW